jgi:hypothetical protein
MRKLTLGCAVLSLLILCACAQGPNAASKQAAAASAAEMLAKVWGAEPGSAREAISSGLLRSMVDDPVLIAAAGRRPLLVSDEKYWGQLEREGYAMLQDDVLRRVASLKLKLLQDATADECQSYLTATASGAWLGPDAEMWRRRLSRASDEDFWSWLQLSKQALLERARRIDETAYAMTEREYNSAFATLVMSLPESIREEMFSVAARPGEPKAADVCRFAVQILRAQSTASGPALRIGYAAGPK